MRSAVRTLPRSTPHPNVSGSMHPSDRWAEHFYPKPSDLARPVRNPHLVREAPPVRPPRKIGHRPRHRAAHPPRTGWVTVAAVVILAGAALVTLEGSSVTGRSATSSTIAGSAVAHGPKMGSVYPLRPAAPVDQPEAPAAFTVAGAEGAVASVEAAQIVQGDTAQPPTDELPSGLRIWLIETASASPVSARMAELNTAMAAGATGQSPADSVPAVPAPAVPAPAPVAAPAPAPPAPPARATRSRGTRSCAGRTCPDCRSSAGTCSTATPSTRSRCAGPASRGTPDVRTRSAGKFRAQRRQRQRQRKRHPGR